MGPLLRYVVKRTDWHARLLNGSDYPLPGYIPEVSIRRLVEERFIARALEPVLGELRQYDPLLFDLVLKRHLEADGTRFAASVFETAGYFAGAHKAS